MVNQSSLELLRERISSLSTYCLTHVSPKELDRARHDYYKYLLEVDKALAVVNPASDDAHLKIQTALSGLGRYFSEFNWHADMVFYRNCRKLLEEIHAIKQDITN